jgi:hypothetical protein
MHDAEIRSGVTQRDLRALILAAIVFGAILVGISSCGDGDLGFPGQAAPTSTAAPTATEEPDDET